MAQTSPYAAKPSALKAGPVPGNEQADEVAALLSAYDAPEMPAAKAEAAPEQAPPSQPVAEAAPVEDPSQFPVEEQSSVMGINTDIRQQLADLPVRIQANLAGDPASVKLSLENRLGKQNVKERDGEIFFKRQGEKAFRRLDPKTFEVINDVIGDFYKEGIQAIGGAAGAIAGAPLGPAGAIAGTGLGVAGATAAAGALGEQAMGVKRAPESFALESSKAEGLKGAASRTLEKTGEAAKAGTEYAALEGIFANLAGRWAAKRASTEGIKKLTEIPPAERLQESVKQNLETLKEMKSLGLTAKIPGTNVEIPAHQLLPYVPDVQKVAQSVSAEKAFQQAQKEAAENFGQAALNLVEEASGITKGRMSQAIKTGVPGAKETSAAEITGLFNSVRKAEGAVIGEFRKLAKETAKDTPLPATNTHEALNNILNGLGARFEEGKVKFPDDDSLAQILGTDSKSFISGLKEDLNRLVTKSQKYGLTIDELIGQSQIMGAKNEGATRVGGKYKRIIGTISSSLRADAREGMKMILDPEDAANYAAKMERFSSIATSMDKLEAYLRDDIGMNTFAKGLINKGKEGIANLKAAKEFLLKEKPELYRNLIGEYMEELALKSRDPSKVAGFNPQAMRKELASLGTEYLDELFPKSSGVDKSLVLRSFDLADQVQRSVIKGSDAELIKDAKKAVGALSLYHRGVNAVYALGNFGTKNNRLLKILSREGVESFLTEVPKKNKAAMRETLNSILTLARQNGTLATINSNALGNATMNARERISPSQPQVDPDIQALLNQFSN